MIDSFSEYSGLSLDELRARLFEIEDFLSHIDSNIADEDAKFKRYKVRLYIINLNTLFIRMK